MTQLFSNKAVRRLVAALAVLLLGMGAAGLTVIHLETQRMNQQLLRRDAAVVGGFLREKDLRDNAVVTGTLEEEDVQVGRQALSSYSFDQGRDASYPFYAEWVRRQNTLLLTWLAVFAVLCAGACLLTLGGVYRRIRKVTEAASRVSQGQLVRLPQEGEGDMAALHASFEDMSRRIQHGMEHLQQDKHYLKDFLLSLIHI